MANAIGQVVFISGNVKAVDSAGNERILDINSMVYLGETIVTQGTDSRVMLKMDNQLSITLGRDDKLTLDSDIYDPDKMPADESIVSVESIQEALLGDPNFDPSELEATAAGGNPGSPGDSTAEPVLITHNLQGVEFDFLGTTGINDGLLQNDDFIEGNSPEAQLLFATLTLSGVAVVFEGDAALYSLSLDNAPITDLVIELTISHIDTDDNDLTPGVIFVTIPAGSTSVQFSVDNFDDFISDNNEDYQVQITGTSGGAYTSLTIGNDTQTTTILDETSTIDPDPEDPVTMKLIALDINGNEVSVSEVSEGNIVSYIAVLEDENGNRVSNASGTVEVSFEGISATNDVDFNTSPLIVSIGVPFSTNTIDDYIADNDETFTVKLIDGSYSDASSYEKVDIDLTPMTTTIIDDSRANTPNDPTDGIEPDMETVTLKLIALDSNGNEVATNEAAEGETASYKVVLEDPSGARITSATGTIQVAFSGDAADVNTAIQTVTLGQTFSTSILDDYIADNGETFTAQIIDDSYSNASAYENVEHDVSAITTTILDDSQPDTPNVPTDGIEPNMETVTLKLIALDANGNEVLANDAVEGETASYKVVLEDPYGARISTATGTVQVSFNGDAADVNTVSQTVAIGQAFSTSILDDYIADNGETFTAQIIDDSYSNASAYENVVHDIAFVTTTIFDNSQPNTPNDSLDDTIEPDIDTVIIRLIAVENGVPIIGNDGNYLLVNEVPEGDIAQFMALAFVPGTSDFNASTQTSDQLGSIDLSFSDQTATGSDSKALDVTPNHAQLNAGESAFDFTTEFTISVDVIATGNGGIIFNKENAYEIAQEADGSIRYALRADNGSGWVWNDTGYDLPDNELHNLTFVYDGASNTITLYEDGIVVASSSQNVPSSLINNNNDLLFGERGHNNQSFEGQFDNIRIYNVALSNSDVANIGQVSNGLIAHYDFNGNDPLTDRSGNNNDASLANGASISNLPLDYDSASQTNIALGAVISTDVFDDYMADSGETFSAQITENSYQPPVSGGGYETVDIITDPVVISITDNSLPGTPNIPADDTIEADAEVVIIKLFAAENGIPLIDANGNYILLNDVAEGDAAQYVAFAFEPGTTVFNASTLTSQQVGTVDIQLTDNGATGVNAANVNSLDVTANHAHLNVGESAYDFTNAFTVSLNVLATGNGGIIFNKENAYEIAQEADGSIRYALRADNGSGWVWNDTGYDLPDNELHNLTFVYDGASNTITLYEDGVVVASSSQNVPDELILNNNDLLFGERGHNNQSFEGQFDEIRIYDSALSAAEVVDLANGIDVSNHLVSYYDFDGSNPLTDKSGNGNDASLESGAVLHSEAQADIDGSEDYDATMQEAVTLGQVFDVDTFDDYLSDSGEQFNVNIIDLSYKPGASAAYESVEIRNEAVVTTILDGSSGDQIPDQNIDTIFAIITGDTGVVEGQTASYRVELFDINGNSVDVTNDTDVVIRFNNISTQDGDTQYNNNQAFTVTIPIGQSYTTFTTDTINDQPVDSGENYSLTIDSVVNTGEFERIIPGDSSGNQTQLITTITDINDAPIAQADSADAIEAGTASFDDTDIDADISVNAIGNVLNNDTDIDTLHSQLTVSAISSNNSSNTSSQTGNTYTITGKYGVLEIDTDGSFKYIIDDTNTDVDVLNVGDQIQESFNYTVNDNEQSGALTDSDTLTITINGTNDAPDAKADIGPIVTESDMNVGAETINQVNGNVLNNDTDVDNTNSDLSVTHISQGLGLNISGGNNQTLVMAESSSPALLGGATQVSLNIGLSSTQATGSGGILSYASSGSNNEFLLFMTNNSLNLYLDGSNISTGITRSELFDGDVHQLGVEWDSATGQAYFYLDGVLEGSGNIGQGHTLDSNGTLMFAQEQDSVGGSLDANQVISANFHNIDISTNASANSSAHWNFNDITGGSSTDQSGNYTLSIENNVSHTSGTTVVNSNDVELLSNLVPITISGAYGELSIDADGNYSYDLYDNNPTVDALNVGEQLYDKFNYTMTDNESGVEKYDSAILTLTIQGSNDAPIVSNDSATAYEDGLGLTVLGQQEAAIQATGNVLDNDQDVDSLLTVTEINGQTVNSGGSVTLVGTYGSIEIFSDGHYIYTTNESHQDVEQLNLGDTLSESFNYIASDGSLSDSGQLDITIQGRDDRPEAQANSNSINELRDDITTTNEITGNLIIDNDQASGVDSDIDNALSDLFIADNSSDSGVAINASGGNDQALVYNEISGNNLLSGAQTVDVTMILSSTETGNGAIFSFASNANNNDFLLFMSGNTLSLYLGGPAVNTGITRSELFDGNVHTLQTTWDSSTGQANFYLDGNLEGSVITQQAYTLGNGVITLAQEQDSVGGSFDANQAISATYFDLKIMTDISSADWPMDSVAGGLVVDNNGLHNFTVDNNITHSQNVANSQTNANEIFVDSNFAAISDPSIITLQYGTLTLYSDGRYTYELDDANTVVQALDDAEELTDTYRYTLSDGMKVDMADLDIKIIGTNDSPVLDLDSNDSSGASGSGFQTIFTENQPAVSISDSDTLISDFETDDIQSARIVLKNYDASEDVINTSAIGAIPGVSVLSASAIGNDYVIELTGVATIALYQQAIESIHYSNSSELPDESRLIQFEISVTDDGGLTSNTAISTIQLNAAPDPIDDTATVAEGQISISDTVLGNDTDQGTVSSTVHQFTYVDELGAIQSANAGDIVDTQFGHNFTINSNGSWSYTSDQSEFHRDAADNEQNSLLDKITYTLIDTNGDISNPAKLDITVTDTAPQIGDPVDSSIDERYLSTGSEPDPSATTVMGTLDLVSGADTFDATFVVTQSAPTSLTSAGLVVTYSVDSTGHILTASTINGPVFTVTLINPQAANASYEFELIKALDNINNLADIPLNFDIAILDSDGDTDFGDFTVTVIDDLPPVSKQMSLDEDSSDTITTSADATSLNTSISTQGDYGVAVINPDGTLTYTPSGNYSGSDTVIYTTLQDDGTFKNTTVNITVNPVSDLPGMDANKTIDVYEDDSYDRNNYSFNSEGSYQIALNLNVPVQNDAIDQNAILTGDNPERMQLIQMNISNASEGQLLDNNGNVIINSIQDDNETYHFYLVDNVGDTTPSSYHYAGLNTTGAIAITQAQYESLLIIPKEDDAGGDILFTISTRSHEVQDDGTLFSPDVRSDIASQVVTLKIHAVTDPVSLEENQLATQYDGTNDGILNVTINEDETLDLRELLVNSFGDNDGSEEHYFDVEGLVPGSQIVIDGVIRTADNLGNISQVRFSGDDTEFTLTPPVNWDGDMDNITITLRARDTDSNGQSDAIDYQDDTITLNLTVEPVAGDVLITNPASGLEDSAIYLFKDANGLVTINTTDHSGSSSDTVTGVKILKSTIDGIFSTDNGTLLPVDDGSYWVFDPTKLADYKITPPGQSSTDLTITLLVETTDGASVVETTESNYLLQVTPSAEVIATDADNDGSDDLTMNADHNYVDVGSEDNWFALDRTEFDIDGPWNNQDAISINPHGSEETFASFSAEAGSQFRYHDGSHFITLTVTTSQPFVDVPRDYLDTVEFMAPSQKDGDFTILVEAKTVDHDEDDPTITDTSISGQSTLTLHIDPVADQTTVSVNKHQGLEDAGRDANGNVVNIGQNGIALDIRVQSDDLDGSENFTLKIESISDGAVIYYDGIELIAVNGMVEIVNFDAAKTLDYVPKHNDNNDENLQLSAKSVEHDGSSSAYCTPINMEIQIKGVADSPVNNELNTITVDTVDYNEVVSEDNLISLSDVYQTPTQIQSYDNDGSEALTMLLTGLPDGFDVLGAQFMGGTGLDRQWIFDKTDLQNIQISPSANYSGELAFKVSYVTTEDDGDTHSEIQNVSVLITPATEATLIVSEEMNEDVVTRLNFTLDQHSDNNEFLSAVWIDSNSVPSGAQLEDQNGQVLIADADGFIKLTDANAINNIYIRLPEDSDMPQAGTPDILGAFNLTVRYEITDPSNDGSVSPAVTMSSNTSYTVSVHAIADKPVLDIDTNNLITFDDNGTDYIAIESTANQDNEYTFTLELSSKDLDGSETANQFRISGVPDGMYIKDAIYAGDVEGGQTGNGTDTGIWYLNFNEPSGSGSTANGVSTQEITFIVGPDSFVDNSDRFVIEVNGSNIEHRGGDSASSDPYLLYLGYSDTVSPNSPDSAMTDNGPDDFVTVPSAKDPINIIEDNPVLISDIIEAQQIDTTELLSINIHGLPPGTTVSGAITEVDSNGDTFWIASSMNAQIIFPENFNDNNKGTSLDNILFNITSSEESGDSFSYTVPVPGSSIHITPVTDLPEASETLSFENEAGNIATEALEDGRILINIDYESIDNSPTYPNPGQYAQVQNNVSVQLIDGVGVLQKSDGSSYPFDAGTQTWSVPVADLANLQFIPGADFSGDVRLQYSIESQELNAVNTESVTNEIIFEVMPVVDGYNIPDSTILTASGNEDSYIAMNFTGNLLDPSEDAIAALLKDVPVGMLVYIGADVNNLSAAKNAGGDGTTNTWNIDVNADGTLPKIWFKPELNNSGQFNNIALTVIVADGAVTDSFNYNVQLDVLALADGLSISPTNTFGVEGDDIPVNLNAMMGDLDGSETISLTLDGLGAGTIFKLNGDFISTNTINYDQVNDVYTLSELPSSEINNLAFVQESFNGSVHIEGWTVETDNNNVSSIVTGDFNVAISPDPSPDNTLTGTNANDSLVGLSGNDILSGLDGDDLLYAGTGDDYMTGGSGIDRFVSSAGSDTISDYNQADGDVLVLSDLLQSDAPHLLSHLSVEDDGSDNVKINVLDDSGVQTGHSVVLEGISYTGLGDTSNSLGDLLTKINIDDDFS